jgi:hypothetical protein
MENFSSIANCQAASEKIKVFKKYIAAVERRRASTFREVRELTGLSEGAISDFIDNDKNNDKLTAYQDQVLSKFIEQRKLICPQRFNLTSSPTMSQNVSNIGSIDTSTSTSSTSKSSIKRAMSHDDFDDDCIIWEDDQNNTQFIPKKFKIEPVETIGDEKQECLKSSLSDDDFELTFNQTQELDAIERKHKANILVPKNTTGDSVSNTKSKKHNSNNSNKGKKQENIDPSSVLNKESIGLEAALSIVNQD